MTFIRIPEKLIVIHQINLIGGVYSIFERRKHVAEHCRMSGIESILGWQNRCKTAVIAPETSWFCSIVVEVEIIDFQATGGVFYMDGTDLTLRWNDLDRCRTNSIVLHLVVGSILVQRGCQCDCCPEAISLRYHGSACCGFSQKLIPSIGGGELVDILLPSNLKPVLGTTRESCEKNLRAIEVGPI